VCYVPDSGIDQMVARIVSLKAAEVSDLYSAAAVARCWSRCAPRMRGHEGLPFHVAGGSGGRSRATVRSRSGCARSIEEHLGERPFLFVLDFVQLLGGAREGELGEMMGRVLRARQVARERNAASSRVDHVRETRPAGRDDRIHRDRRQPSSLAAEPGRLVLGAGDGRGGARERHVLVLAQELEVEAAPK